MGTWISGLNCTLILIHSAIVEIFQSGVMHWPVPQSQVKMFLRDDTEPKIAPDGFSMEILSGTEDGKCCVWMGRLNTGPLMLPYWRDIPKVNSLMWINPVNVSYPWLHQAEWLKAQSSLQWLRSIVAHRPKWKLKWSRTRGTERHSW